MATCSARAKAGRSSTPRSAAWHLPGAHLSRTTVIYGHSQGGQAALFAAELAPTYAPGLHVVGVAAAAPATGLTTIMAFAFSPAGQSILPLSLPVAWSWPKLYKDLPASRIFTPYGAKVAGGVVTTGCLGTEAATIATKHLTVAELFRKSAATDPVVVAHAKLNNPGRVRSAMPMLVVQGTADTTVPPPLTDAYVTTMACPIGDRIEYLHVTGATHGTVVDVTAPTIVTWMKARLAGVKAPTTCGLPGDVHTISP